MLIHKTKCPISYLDKGEKRGFFFFFLVLGGGEEEALTFSPLLVIHDCTNYCLLHKPNISLCQEFDVLFIF